MITINLIVLNIYLDYHKYYYYYYHDQLFLYCIDLDFNFFNLH